MDDALFCSGLSQELPDPETVRRVWERVMAGREAEPPALSPGPEPPAPCPAPPARPQPLESLLDLAASRAVLCRTLARRGGSQSHALAAISGDCRAAYRRLDAARYLITGEPYRPRVSSPVPPRDARAALRLCWLQCGAWTRLCREAALPESDPVLLQLLAGLEAQGEGHAGVLRALLEQICPAP